MRTARVDFPSGRELLAAYWGFIGSGGLVVAEGTLEVGAAVEGDVGDPVVLEVRIASLRKEYRLAGHIRRKDDLGAVVAFDEGQAQDMLLAAAWADGQDVPERRHRRWNVEVPVRFRSLDGEGAGRLVNLSRGGCCLRLDAPVGGHARIYIVGERFLVDGVIRWARSGNRLVGIEFGSFHEDLVHQILGTPSGALALQSA